METVIGDIIIGVAIIFAAWILGDDIKRSTDGENIKEAVERIKTLRKELENSVENSGGK